MTLLMAKVLYNFQFFSINFSYPCPDTWIKFLEPNRI